MHAVQFTTADADSTRQDFTVLRINAEFIPSIVKLDGHVASAITVVAAYDESDWRQAARLREWMEAHHCEETEGRVRTLPVIGWEQLVEDCRVH